jgi:peptide-methionine (R)-S-oxide reductase
MKEKIQKSEKEWKKTLTPEQFAVLRKKGTEPPFSGTLLHNKEKGVYVCAACGQELFTSGKKYDSGSGWPSFWDSIAEDRFIFTEDHRHGMRRIEVMCSRCGSHLGHVFDDGPQPTGKRYCINSVALGFSKE